MDISGEYESRCDSGNDIALHLPFLYSQAFARKPAVVIELGVRSGNSTSAFLAADADLWSVDREEPRVPPEWHSFPGWHFLMADDLNTTARDWLPQQADILFVDTDHTYEQAVSELEIYAPRVRPGGLVLMHDTHFMDGFDIGTPDGPVAHAIRDYCADRGLEWASRPGSYGLGVIQIPKGSCG